MEKRIELEKRGRRANQITELNLDNCRSTSIVGLTDEFTALESLSLINVGLTTLKGFPKLPNLKKLELSDNRISNGLNYLTTSPKLTHLNLSGNKIKDLETLKPLESFQNLEVLDLFNNESTAVENYREKIFAMIPSLKYLDGFDANEVEASSDGDDDEEVNGNDSEDEDNNSFCINGLEIDLAELDEFEKHLREKKAHRFDQPDKFEPDYLDDYLSKLTIEEKSPRTLSSPSCDTIKYPNLIKPNDSNEDMECECTSIEPSQKTKQTSIPLLMYGFVAILSLVSFSCFSDEMCEDEDDGEDEDEDDDDSDDDDNGDVSLAKIYNDDLEEDNSDWEEEIEAEDDDDEESDEEEGADEAAKQKEAETPAEEPQARGKKRKHEDV